MSDYKIDTLEVESQIIAPAATVSVAGLQSATDKTKLDSVQTGATVNSTDAQLRNRVTHTGTQTASTISDFNAAASIASPVQSVAGKTGVVALVKADVDLANVDNTSDTTKNSAIATLSNKTLTSPVINTPIGIVKADVGLPNVDNTSDINKPVSTAQQTVLNLKYDASNPNGYEIPSQLNTRDTNNRARTNHTGIQLASTISDFSSAADARITAQKAVANGLATLGADSKILSSQLPAIAISDTFIVGSQAAMLVLIAETGDVAVRTDLNKSFILRGTTASILTDWQELLTPTDTVLSVNGQTGVVSLTTTSINEGSNLYFTASRVLATLLAGYMVGANTILSAADSVLVAFGKVQAQINNLLAVKADKAIILTPNLGLVGGGDLSANRTISMQFPETVNRVTIIQSIASSTYANVTELVSPILVVGTYICQVNAICQSTGVLNGIGLRVMDNSGIIGTLCLKWGIASAADGTDKTFEYTQNATSNNITSGLVFAANVNLPISGLGMLTITTAGTIAVQIRSELPATSVSIRPESILLLKRVT